MSIEALALFIMGMLVSVLVRDYFAKKEEKRWRERFVKAETNFYHSNYRWNVAICQLGAIRSIAQETLETKQQGSPYRGDPTAMAEALKRIDEKTKEILGHICREVGCFHTLREAEEFMSSLDDGLPHTYPMVVKHEEWDGTCYHVIYGTNVEEKQTGFPVGDNFKKVAPKIEEVFREKPIGHLHPAQEKNPCAQCEGGKPKYECIGQCATADDFVGYISK